MTRDARRSEPASGKPDSAPASSAPAPSIRDDGLGSPQQVRLSRLLVAAAAILWSTSGFFAKAPLFEDWPLDVRGPLLAFWRAVFASLVLVPLVRRPRWTVKLIPMALVFAAMNFTYLSAMAHTTAANAIWLQNTAPVWVFLIGVLMLGEPVHRGDWLMLALGVLGVAVILAFELQGESQTGIIYGLLAGVFYAGVVLSIRHLRAEEPAWLVTVNHVVTAAILLPYVLYHDIWPNAQQVAYLAGFGMFQMGIPYLLFARGVHHIAGHEASGIALLEPVLVPVWVFLAWRNAPSYQGADWWTIAGGSLILAGLIMRYFGLRRQATLPALATLNRGQSERRETEHGDQ